MMKRSDVLPCPHHSRSDGACDACGAADRYALERCAWVASADGDNVEVDTAELLALIDACRMRTPTPRPPMCYRGRVWQDGDHWLIECTALDLMTQGVSFQDAMVMLKDAVEALVNEPDFKATVIHVDGERVALLSNNDATLAALAAKRTVA